jgi:hypothetical protein
MADGLLSGITDAIKNQYQTTKRGFGLLVNDPSQFAKETTARYFPTKEEERQFRMVKEMGGDITQTPYYQKIFDLTQFQGSLKPLSKTQFQVANEVAQKNATEMLGLPPDNTAMDRAKALGFDMPMYHGTDVPSIEAFDPKKTKIVEGVFATNNTKTASKYAEEAGLKNRAASFGMESSPNVLPLLIKSESHTRIPKFDIQTIDRFKKYGDKGVYRDEMGVSVTFDPSQIRSRFAAFDPARVNESDLLAAGIPIGLLGSTQVELPKKQEKKPKK